MYTANLVQIDKTNQTAVVKFTNGTDTQTVSYPIGTDIQAQVTAKVSSLNASESVPLAVGIITPTPPVTPPVPTQSDIDLANFQKWMQLTIALNAAKSLGWITGNEQVVLDAKVKVLAIAIANISKLFS
jgi:hypothetical protein